MDREEYHQKLDELTSYVREKDYDNALSIVDSIDWRRVKSINTLNMVADVYEVNKDYESAKDILILAYNRASIGRNILYRLVEVCIKLNQIDEAEKYFKEFSKVARNDNSRCILQYKLYKAKGAPLEAQIDVLEEYKEREYTERWSYELALLYAKAGDAKKCVETCDDLILWFSEGRYVLKAMELKKKYEALTPSQEQSYNRMKVAENRRKADLKAKSASEDVESTESDATARAGLFTEENRRPSNAQAVYVRPVKQADEQSRTDERAERAFAQNVQKRTGAQEVPVQKSASGTSTSDARHARPSDFSYGASDVAETSGQTKSAEETLSPAAAAAAKARKDGTAKKMNTADFNLDAFLAETAGAFSSEVHEEQAQSQKPLQNKPAAEPAETQKPLQDKSSEPSESQKKNADSVDSELSDKENGSDNLDVDVRKAGPANQSPQAPEEVEAEIDEDALDADVAQTEVAVEGPDGGELETRAVEEAPEKAETSAAEAAEAVVIDEVSEDTAIEPEIVEEPAESADTEPEVVEESAEVVEETPEGSSAEQEAAEEIADATDTSYKDAGAASKERNSGIRLRDLKEEDLSTEVTPLAQRAEAETNAAVHGNDVAETESHPQSEGNIQTAAPESTEQPKKKEIHYIEELEVPDPKPTEAERNSHTHTIPLDTIGANTIPISIDKILSEETPEERRIRIMNRARPTRMNEEQRKIFTYFARIPGMDAQILEAISCVYEHAGEKTSLHGNIAVMGARGTGKTRLTHGLVVAMCKDLGIEAAKVARVKGADLNAKDPAKVVARMAGGFFIIEEVSGMNEETVGKLSQAMEFRTDCMITIIEDEKVAMRAFLKKYPRFAAKFDRVISIPVFTNDELITFARTYATENGFKIDDMAILALYTMIGNMQTEEEPVTISVVKDIIDKAINRSSAKRRRGKKNRKDKWLVLQEKDFDLT